MPASDGHAVGTIVAVEGGPGYPSTGSYDEYAGTFHTLLKTHNLVLVDNRGTGGSGILGARVCSATPDGPRGRGSPSSSAPAATR